MEGKKFRLITAIDRINYFSDNFIDYYKKFFLNEEFYFMVHFKNYEEIKRYLFSKGFNESNVEQYKMPSFGEGHNVVNQNRIKTNFINQGYIVVYADMDERIYHPDLRNYILNSTANYIIPKGIQIVQCAEDAPLDKTKNVLEQRTTCVIDERWYSKVCILREDYNWTAGRHNKPGVKPKIDNNVYLVDIGKVCKDFMIENNNASARIYNRVVSRYKENNKQKIELEVYNKIMMDATHIPTSLKNSNMF